MKTRIPIIPIAVLAAVSTAHAAPVYLSLNDVTPGTENVTLIPNGDFESGTSPSSPDNWNIALGAVFFDTPASAGLTGFSNLPASGKVAYNETSTSSNFGFYAQDGVGSFDANTEYVFSAYVWNNSVAAHGTALNFVMDFNDVASEAQIIVAGTRANAADGYFVYETFNTGDTGTGPFRIRTFAQPVTYSSNGTPVMVWDDVAITKASEFVAPSAAPVPESGATLVLLGLGLAGMAGFKFRKG